MTNQSSIPMKDRRGCGGRKRDQQYGADKEGYWTGERFMEQMNNAVDIADIKYGGDRYTVVWLFDQSS